MSQNKRRGFTLVELLVVITIIGILMAITIPAVQVAVETARSAQCQTHLKNLAVAATTYETSKQRFPGYSNRMVVISPPANIRVTWALELLPNMGRQDIYDGLVAGGTQTPFIDFLVCPSNPPTAKDGPYLAYVANAGYQQMTLDPRTDTTPGKESIANGIFHNYFPDTNPANINVKGPSMNRSQISDGDSTTLLFSENMLATKYWGPEAINPASSNQAPDKQATVFVWHGADTPPERKINGNKNDPTLQLTSDTARPSSMHGSSVNVVYAGAQTGKLNETMDYHVYVQLMTPRHLQVNPNLFGTPAWRQYILDGKDYQ